jgi:putative ABC transport system permease protein
VHPIVDIAWWRLSLTGLCLLALLALLRAQRVGIERTLVIASLRGTTQLLAVGYVLGAIFAIDRPELVLATLLVMLGMAAHTSMGRLSTPLPGIRGLAALSLALGTSIGVVFMSRVVVQTSPWYDPQYLIPFGGMLLGNSMNGASLAGERFQEGIRMRRLEVEARLALGFKGPDAVHPILVQALRAAMIPTVNSFMVAGVVQLPGMMTGQILSGTDPIIAVKYQILIFFLLLTSVAVSTLTFLSLLRGRYVNDAHQLVLPLMPEGRAGKGRGGGGRGLS